MAGTLTPITPASASLVFPQAQYQGAHATSPTIRDSGTPLQIGDLYYDTVIGGMYVYDGSVWVNAAPAASAAASAAAALVSETAAATSATNATTSEGNAATSATNAAASAADAAASAASSSPTNASGIVNTPAGGIAATDVQAAINELDTEKAPLASPAFTGTPTLPTGATGVTQAAADNSTKLATTAYVDAAGGVTIDEVYAAVIALAD